MTKNPEHQEPHSQVDNLIERVYDLALDPSRYEELRDSWDNLIISKSTRSAANVQLMDPKMSNHFERVLQVLDTLDPLTERDYEAELLAQFENVSAMVITSQLNIRAANPAAVESLSITGGASIKTLPLEKEDIAELSRQVARMIAAENAPSSIFRVRSLKNQKVLIFQMRRMNLSGVGPVVVAATSDLRLPDGFNKLLGEAFQLTSAEVDVVRLLIECCSVKEIAAFRGRSIDTIRAQIKTILAKTETNSQVELLRLVLSMMDMAAITVEPNPGPELVSQGQDQLESLPYHTVYDEGGRRLDYLVLGDPRGRPLLFVTSEYGFSRWPASAEREAKERGIKIISPMRAGYGYSDLVPKSSDFCEQIALDLLTVLDAEGVTSLPVVTMTDDHHFTTQMEKLRAGTVSATIATAGGLPYINDAQLQRMDKWYRFIQAGARVTPQLLPFMVRMGYHLLRKIGVQSFFRTIYSDSKADLETLNEREVMEAILISAEAVFAKNNDSHKTFISQTLFEQDPGLIDHVNWLNGRMPVHFLLGLQDPAMPAETIAEHQLEFDWIDFRIYPDSGQLLLFKKWRDVLDLAEEYL